MSKPRFLLIPILRFKPWSGGTWLLLALTVIAGLTLPNIVETIVNTAALLGDGYNAEEFIGEGVNVFRVLVASVPVLLTFSSQAPRQSKQCGRQCVYQISAFLYACIMFVGLFGTANYFGRLANYFSIFPAIVLPMILQKTLRAGQTLPDGVDGRLLSDVLLLWKCDQRELCAGIFQNNGLELLRIVT